MQMNQHHSKPLHSPTIKNEVAKTLYPALQGMIFDLERLEKTKQVPPESRINLYKEISYALSQEHRQFYLFSDEEIIEKTTPISKIVKTMLHTDINEQHQILLDNMSYFEKLILTYKVL